jgi:hypothetical protein
MDIIEHRQKMAAVKANLDKAIAIGSHPLLKEQTIMHLKETCDILIDKLIEANETIEEFVEYLDKLNEQREQLVIQAELEAYHMVVLN